MLEFTQVNKSFGSTRVLSDVSEKVQAGEVVVVCGPSGSGKSTLITHGQPAWRPFQTAARSVVNGQHVACAGP
jgi:ABC-type multidrug transport system ATPase subunit